MSAKTRAFGALLIAVVVVSIAVTALLVWDSRRAAYGEADRVTHALASALAASPTVADGLRETPEPEGADGPLQRFAEEMRVGTGLSFVTIMTPEGVRHSHPDPGEIGARYSGTIPSEPVTFQEERSGPLGITVRTIAPVLGEAGELLGWVAVGVTVDTIRDQIFAELPLVAAITAVFASVGLAVALAGRAYVRRVAGDLPSGTVREAVTSYESFRVLSEALRAQTHEHGNRMHAAVALLELGRSEEAAELLAETSRQSQDLVDMVVAADGLDPAVSALILGKAAQAKERGVELEARVDPATPRGALGPLDLVSVVGNLIDNALDAAATGEARHRTVSVRVAPSAERGISIEVSDSGDGFGPGVRERMFEWGFSTKPAGEQGRGIGLALIRRIAEECGGALEAHERPTRFVLTLPGEEAA